MFLKRRKFWLPALTLAAVMGLSLGLFFLRDSVVGSAYPPQETHPAATVTTTVSGDAPTLPPSEPEEPDSQSPLIAGVILLLLGSAAGLVLVFGLGQKKPLLGPVLSMAALLLAVNVGRAWHSLDPGDFWRYIPPVTALGILSLREVWGWLRARCTPDWLLTHRLAALLAKGRSGLYPLVLLPGLLVSLPLMLIPNFLLSVRILGLLILLAELVLLARYCRWVSHLTRQIGQLHRSGTVEVGKGAFAECEAQLADLGRQRDEAIAAAVTGERFKVELISNVSHDLRTPLTAILGYSELLGREQLSDTGRSQLQRLTEKAGYMRELIDQLFELTKVSSGAAPAKREPLDLIRLLEQTLGMYDDALTQADLQVRRHYARGSVPLVSDGTRLHQIFSNLLGNAIKYALPGTRIHLTVSDEKDTWCVRMTNVAAYDMDFDPAEIVQRFARGDKARSTKGSGLGLAIAQTYSESLGGSFRVEIQEEQFSALVTLPKPERNL